MSSLPSHLTDKARDLLGSIFEHVLLEESQLAARTRRYGWRVRGSARQSLNRLFTEQGRQIDRWLGEIAGRARAMGVALTGNDDGADEAVEAFGETPPPARVVIGELVTLHEGMANRLREDVDVLYRRAEDQDATALLTRLLEFHETTAWMLRLLLESPGSGAGSRFGGGADNAAVVPSFRRK